MLVLYLTITIAAFIYPQSGIRANMRKQKLLVSEQITDQLPCTQGGARSEDTDPEKLAALLATRSHIQSLPDWPIGQHTRIRLALYLFIPLLSWEAAALAFVLAQFYLWSYIHITASLALSSAHPRWIVQLFARPEVA